MRIEQDLKWQFIEPKGLNPCSNGMRIERLVDNHQRERACLNPCSNGMRIEPDGEPE